MLFARQRRLLEALLAFGGAASELDFQGVLFLYCHEIGSEGAPYDFVPHRAGPYSFTAEADRRKLIERGLIESEERGGRLTDAGRSALALPLPSQLRELADRYEDLRGHALAARLHREFPAWAIRSEIAERLLEGDESALADIAAARPRPAGPALFTIGYEGRSLESYLDRLLGDGVSLLCDVRRNPISRKFGFSKSMLARGTRGVGIHYEHLPALGIPSERRRGLVMQADFDEMFGEYARDWLPGQEPALAAIRRWIGAGERVALTCYERQVQQCHRRCVAEALEARLGPDLRAVHR